MTPFFKKIARITLLSLLGTAAVLAWRVLPGRRAEVQLAPVSTTTVTRTVLAEEPIYLQTDPKWAGDHIGGSGEILRNVGCTICCLSMALAQHGVKLDPAELNRKLKEADGYTSRGWIKWEALRRASGDRVEVVLPRNPSHHDIDEALAAGNPVLVKVLVGSGLQHWVLLVGRDQKEYLMKDPLGSGALNTLSYYGSDILAVRVVRRL